ncbi:HNH endonuclease [Microbacterium phage Pumpernickel]|uniref:HNH endonuclease n=1 Tax=Microbacterium phage Pumpernickel TaxID=2885983 RepID=A0AAE9C2V9_9CAUD|nr:HNH endonuclease [Microbacterium phage Pumpernickel]UDL15917.1 HNH endonuclease [Microbacterium phage Pumpernickel]
MSSRRAKTIAVYNLGGVELLHYAALHDVMKNVVNGKYRIIEAVKGKTFGEFDWPKAVELVRYRYAKWKYDAKGVVPFSRRGVLRRDNYTCCYCGKHADTVDHVLPKWQGNDASWTNSVAACFPCNNRKGGRSPKEAGMKMLYAPHTPTFAESFSWTTPGRTEDDVVRSRKT